MSIASPLVSIVTPCYNAEIYIAQAIESVIAQTFTSWEMLIVDDCSSDNSNTIIQAYCREDTRIKCYATEKSSGSPAVPRNIGIEKAQGRFIAFLDSDDMWLPTKLEEQIPLFANVDTAIAYSYYEKMDAVGKRNNRIIKSADLTTYKELLKENIIGNVTAMYDIQKVNKMYFEQVGHEDYLLWLTILKKGYVARNTNTVTALYRISAYSVSANKLKAARWTWKIYRQREHLSLLRSVYYFLQYAVRTFLKSLK
jgi:glycosyltransferase involved in cell wall biosynthesis